MLCVVIVVVAFVVCCVVFGVCAFCGEVWKEEQAGLSRCDAGCAERGDSGGGRGGVVSVVVLFWRRKGGEAISSGSFLAVLGELNDTRNYT